jgi:hypothetical protein
MALRAMTVDSYYYARCTATCWRPRQHVAVPTRTVSQFLVYRHKPTDILTYSRNLSVNCRVRLHCVANKNGENWNKTDLRVVECNLQHVIDSFPLAPSKTGIAVGPFSRTITTKVLDFALTQSSCC